MMQQTHRTEVEVIVGEARWALHVDHDGTPLVTKLAEDVLLKKLKLRVAGLRAGNPAISVSEPIIRNSTIPEYFKRLASEISGAAHGQN